MTYRLKTLECPCCLAKLDLKLEFELLTVKPAKDEPWRGTRIENMGLTPRAYNTVRNEWLDCHTAGDVDALSDNDIMRIPNAGRKTLNELREAIAALKA